MIEKKLIQRAKELQFVSLWWTWLTRYQDDASNAAPPAPPFPSMGYGYRAGHFWPRGANTEDTTEEWEYFFHTIEAEQGLPAISVHALYCYDQYLSCKHYIDSEGKDYRFP